MTTLNLVATNKPALSHDRPTSGFANRTQKHLAIRALLSLVGLEELWTPQGPSDHRDELINPAATSPEATQQRVVMHLAWALHDGAYAFSVTQLLELRTHHVQAVMGLLVALTEHHSKIDEWIAAHTLDLRGERLMSMHRAENARWFAVLRMASQRADSLEHAAWLMDVSLTTLRRWIAEDTGVAKMFRGLRQRSSYDPVSSTLFATLYLADTRATVQDSKMPHLAPIELRVVANYTVTPRVLSVWLTDPRKILRRHLGEIHELERTLTIHRDGGHDAHPEMADAILGTISTAWLSSL